MPAAPVVPGGRGSLLAERPLSGEERRERGRQLVVVHRVRQPAVSLRHVLEQLESHRPLAGHDGQVIEIGGLELEVLHTPGHSPGGCCLYAEGLGTVFSGDTLFAGGWGRVDFPGGDAEAMVSSLVRLSTLEDRLRVLPGHGADTTIGRERPWAPHHDIWNFTPFGWQVDYASFPSGHSTTAFSAAMIRSASG